MDGRVVPKVVTHRAFIGGWDTAVRYGLSPSEFSAEIRQLVARVRRTRERVDWDPYMDFLDRVRELAGSPEEMARIFGSHPAAIPELGRIARLFLNPRQLYRFLVGTFATAGYSHIESSLEDLGRDRLRIRTRLPPQYRDGTAFFECCVGGLRVFPQYIELPPAEVAPQISSHEATFEIRVPASRTLASRMAPSVKTAIEELTFYADELRDLTRGASSVDGAGVLERATRKFVLTRRQREVAKLLMRGASNKEIAAELGCAERTVELHVTALMRKTGTSNRTQLAAMLLS